MTKPIRVDKLNDTPLTFGKYKGKTPVEIAETDPKYVIWMYDNVTTHPTCSKQFRDYCEQDERDEEADHAEDQHYEKDGW